MGRGGWTCGPGPSPLRLPAPLPPSSSPIRLDAEEPRGLNSKAVRVTAPYEEKRRKEPRFEPLLGEELVTGQEHLFRTFA